jgi:hypothetical protein
MQLQKVVRKPRSRPRAGYGAKKAGIQAESRGGRTRRNSAPTGR